MQLDLHPVATEFNAGHRIRVTIMCADCDNTEVAAATEGATVHLHRSRQMASRIQLPIAGSTK